MPHPISSSDCGQVVFDPLGSGEIAPRLIVNAHRLELSDTQLDELLRTAHQWRRRFHKLVGEANGDQLLIQRELSEREPSRATIDAAILRRAESLKTIEREFVECWCRVWEIITDEQYETLMELYEEELRLLPPWVLEQRLSAGIRSADRDEVLTGAQATS